MVEFSPIKAKAKVVAIVACGPSLKKLDLPALTALEGLHIISVNRSVSWLPRSDSWFTLDPDFPIRELMQRQRPRVRYYAAVPEDYGLPTAFALAHRKPAEPGVHYLKRIKGLPPTYYCPTLSELADRIHTGNSAWGALQLAYLMGAECIVFFGLDCSKDPYAFGYGTPADLSRVPVLFETAVAQLKDRGVFVLNASPNSLVTAFTRCPVADGLEHLKGRLNAA